MEKIIDIGPSVWMYHSSVPGGVIHENMTPQKMCELIDTGWVDHPDKVGVPRGTLNLLNPSEVEAGETAKRPKDNEGKSWFGRPRK
jgi:hypothetical protein